MMKVLWIPCGMAVFIIALSMTFLVNASPDSEAPEQPIAFSHRVHAGENKIPCLYCHVYARQSAVAGIPSVQRCIGCHRILPKPSPEVDKLKAFWTRKEAIPWVKIYDLPDFVRFSHQAHISREIACAACHGLVADADRIERQSDLSMARCVRCHRAQDGSIDCWTCHK